jgi:septal ring factor EnvC (AmiA/AmiB activator)
VRIVNPFSLPFFFGLLLAVYISQLERNIGLQDDIIMEQQEQLQQLQKELQQQQQLVNNLEQVEVSQDQRIQNLERQNIRSLGKLHECELM